MSTVGGSRFGSLTKTKKWTAFYYTESGGIGGYGQNRMLGFVIAPTKEEASNRAEKMWGMLYSGNYGWVEETTIDHEEEFRLRNLSKFS